MIASLRRAVSPSVIILVALSRCGGVKNGGPGVWDGGPCPPNGPVLANTSECNDTLNAQCQAWAESMAIGAYGWSSCYIDENFGTACTLNPDCGGGAGGCCGALPERCVEGEVCASDTPSSAHHCIKACLGVPDAGTE